MHFREFNYSVTSLDQYSVYHAYTFTSVSIGKTVENILVKMAGSTARNKFR